MSFLITTPDIVSAAATDLAGIGSTLSEANSAAASATTGVVSAGLDEVSAAIAELFGAHGQAYQALSAQAAQFHNDFVQTMTAGANAYASAEGNAAQTLASPAAGVSPTPTPTPTPTPAPTPLQKFETAVFTDVVQPVEVFFGNLQGYAEALLRFVP
jgi:hypothetical protein